MFDTHANFIGNIRRPEGAQQVEVRWPTDEEWYEHNRNAQYFVQDLGRGMSETQPQTTQADYKLYQKVRLPEAPDLSPDEAEMFINAMGTCQINGVGLEPDQATVQMTVAGGLRVKHRLRIPTTAETVQFNRKSARMVAMQHGKQMIRINMQAGAELYGQCVLGTEGYSNGVPGFHGSAAIRAVIQASKEQAEGAKDEDF
jgi:hypothetical protein